ncbi:MAG TPA: helix-turn-helix transcriptional regulator [Candidatus Limnocylindria bacterium]|nr:helix-turn-helix transcriptional regulator [Candidatus Limnocylindria bacterium]
MTVVLGREAFDERTSKGWTLREVAGKAGLSVSTAHRVETGQPVSIGAYLRVAVALGLDPDFALRRRPATTQRQADPVHSAMGEVEATVLRSPAHVLLLDEPYQHYQFAGRADVAVIDRDARALLHIENRTRFPDLQAFAGVWNAKRAYLAPELARRYGVAGGFTSVDHVVVALWSAEVLHTLRLRLQTFKSLCPDEPDGFASWWAGGAHPEPGVRSTLVVFDPLEGQRRTRRRWIGLDQLDGADGRYRGYAHALEALRRGGLA